MGGDRVHPSLFLIVAPHGQTILHVVPAFSGWLDPRLWGAIAVLVGLLFWIRLVRTLVPVAAWVATVALAAGIARSRVRASSAPWSSLL